MPQNESGKREIENKERKTLRRIQETRHEREREKSKHRKN